MRKLILASMAAVAVLATSLAVARDPIRDNRLVITPAKNDHFEAAEYTLGKAELYGYVSDLKETKKITGIVLSKGEKATDMQKHLIAITAKAQSLEAFIDLDGKMQTLVDPTPSPEAPTPPPIDNAGAAATTPAATTPAATTPATTTPPTTDGGH